MGRLKISRTVLSDMRKHNQEFVKLGPVLRSRLWKYNHAGERVHLRGLLVAFQRDGFIHIGWSLCRHNLDVYSREAALYYAVTNAVHVGSLIGNENAAPFSIKEEISQMIGRSSRYFKKAS